MKKSFPTFAKPSAVVVRGLVLLSALGLSACATYYPDSGYGTVYGSSRSDEGFYSQGRPYYSGDGYYDQGVYYGPAYGATTVYYERFSPGYYYRPGYGYYPPSRSYRERDHDRDDHDHDHGRDNDRDRGFVGRAREITGDNPSRDRPHDRDNDHGGDRSGYRPPGQGQTAQPRPSNDSDRSGWLGRARQITSQQGPSQPQQRAQPQPLPEQSREVRRSDRGNDNGSDRNSRGGWAGKARSVEQDR